MSLKRHIKRVLGQWGYDVRRIRKLPPGRFELGREPFVDMRNLVSTERPVIFDVGANVGQTIANFRAHFGQPTIHAFEPSADAFAELMRRYGGMPSIYPNNLALGARSGSMTYFENEAGAEMNSLLEPQPDSWGGGHVKVKRQIAVATVDDYCRDRKIERIDILKTDVQGFDFEVVKGAEGMIRNKAIQLVYMEILFSDMYKGQARLDEIYGFLADRGFALVTFYPFCYWQNRATWTDALFVHPDYKAPQGRPH